MFEISNDETNTFDQGAKIKVIGIGGGGCNAVNTMIRSGLSGVEYIVANTDSQALQANHAPTKVQLGVEITKGLGAGANPEVGRKAALDEYEKLSEVLEGADMVFITAGMGGGTGTGAAPVIAKLCKELGALTVGVVTKPFLFEGRKRFKQADAGIQVLEENVDSLITIPNQRLLYLAGDSLSLVDTFKKADEVLLNAVRGISDLINYTGHINADFADVKTVMSNKGLALMGTGVATGPDRAIKASTEAISSPLLEDVTIDGATGIIINITGNSSLTMHETNEAVTLIMEAADEDAEIIFGTVIDDDMGDDIKVTVVATGLGGLETSDKKSQQVSYAEKPIITPSEQVALKPQVSIKQEITRENAEITPSPQEGFRAQREVVQEEPINIRESNQNNVETPLMASIRSAASSYSGEPQEHSDSQRAELTTASTPERRPVREESVPSKTSTRAKSIAEKLGFINFDEEELDTPTFLRKDDDTNKNEEGVKRTRSLDV